MNSPKEPHQEAPHLDVRGVDFTSTPTRNKPITCARCVLDGKRLTVRSIERLASLEAFEGLLAEPGRWIAGLDFPFGQPRQLIENLVWPQRWAEYVDSVGRLTREGFGEVLSRYKERRQPGDREHFRAVDRLTRSQSPSKWFGIPMGKMFFEGAQRLMRSPASILPMRPLDDPRIVVEAYPALVARAIVGEEKYKPEANEAQALALQTRARIVSGLAGSPFKSRYGFTVVMSAEIQKVCIEDASGDSVDAVLAAVQAAWALARKDEGYGIPQNCDLLEGWIVDPVTQPNRNSSITRVRPLFQQLITSDPSGAAWVPSILGVVSDNPVAKRMLSNPGRLRPSICAKRSYADRLQGDIELEECFEFSVRPGAAFLRWLLKSPDHLEWPVSGGTLARFSKSTNEKREGLIQSSDPARRQALQTEGMRELAQSVGKSEKKWWAFEGATEVDCFLETDTFVLVIEGKRTESLSESTAWYRGRNQLHRNLEAARDLAAGREFGVLVISEDPLDAKALGDPEKGLPHLPSAERAELMTHYLGCVTWRQVCSATGIPFESLPRNIARRAVQEKGRKTRSG